MKKTLLIVALVAIALLAGCSSTAESTQAPAGMEGLPEWTYDAPVAQDVIYGAGYGNLSNLQNSIKMAQTAARNVLAESISTAVNEIITTYTNDAGSGANRQAMDAFENLSIQNASAVLTGVTQEELYINPADNSVWVLMSIPKANVETSLRESADEVFQSETFVRNEASAEANAMLDNAIEKYFGLGGVED